jgi:peptide/nickel transport system substrate-binding protein
MMAMMINHILKKRLLLPAIILLGCFSSAVLWGAQGATPEKDKYGGVLRIGLSREPLSLDPRSAGPSSTNQWGFQQLYSHLTEFREKDLDMIPGLAVKWDAKDDLTWIVQLRKGVKYHNGKEMTAEDVALNLDWKINSSKYTQERGWKPFRGRESATAVKNVTAVDRYTLRFNLKYPFAGFVNTVLGWGMQYGPIDPEVVEKYDRAVAMHPMGTGPFKFGEYVSGDHITLERFDGYWGRKPYLDKVLFRFFPDAQTRLLALQKGEVDIAEIDTRSVSLLEKDPNVKIYKIAPPTRMEGFVWFNFRRWPMNQLKFRRAVAMGADWRGIAEAAVPKGCYIPWLSLFKGSFVENPEAEKWFPTYNPKEARRLLSEVEKEAGKSIPPIYALARENMLGANIAMLAANQLKKIGLNLDLQIKERNVAINIKARDPKVPWDIAFWSKKGPGIDPSDCAREFFSESRASGDGQNMPGYKDPKVEELIIKAAATYDRRERIKLYQELERILLKDQQVVLPLVNIPWIYGVRKNVHDFKPHKSSFLYIVSPWSNIWVEK